MYRKLTLFIAFSAIPLLLLVFSFTPLVGGGVNPTTHGPGIESLGGVPILALTGADSIKKHGTGGAGTVFPINMPLSATLTSGTSGVEDRQGGDSDGGGTGEYTIVLHFSNTLVSVESVSVTDENPPCMQLNPIGCEHVESFEIDGNDIIVHLFVIDPQVLEITATNVSDGSQTINPDPVAVGFLIGDTTGNRCVNSSDIAQTKSKSGQSVDSTNFRTDLNHDGAIDASDISLVKSRSGRCVP